MGGKAPHHALNLEDFLQVEGSSDLYVLGYDYDYKFITPFPVFYICHSLKGHLQDFMTIVVIW